MKSIKRFATFYRENTVASALGGSSVGAPSLYATDSYAPGDARVPKGSKKIQKRRRQKKTVLK